MGRPVEIDDIVDLTRFGRNVMRAKNLDQIRLVLTEDGGSAQGPAGPEGPQGPAGADGATGAPGADGQQGIQGVPGSAGAPGANGADGADGLDGVQGPQGDAGPQGIQGVQGNPGSPGSPGADGADGAQGNQGIQGIQGPQGDVGPPGSSLDAWPVGSVYIAVDSTSPATRFGGGTWAAFGAGRVLVGLDSGDANFDTAEETGGTKTVASAGTNAAETAHTHTYTQVPNHVHPYTVNSGTTDGTWASFDSSTTTGTGRNFNTANNTGGVATGTTNAGSSHNHAFTGSATSVVQPYIVVYMWKRTA